LKNNQKANLLLVEDDLSLGERLRKGYNRGLCNCARESVQMAWRICEEARSILSFWTGCCPIFPGLNFSPPYVRSQTLAGSFLTARDEVEDRVKGLDSGADDYLTKPFAFSELLARIRTLLRRMAVTTEKILEFGSLRIDLITRKASCNLQPIELTPREFDLLAVLANPEGDTVSRETLSHDVWQKAGRFTSLDNVIDVHLTHLRKKLRASMGDDPIKTVRGVGYTFQRIA
jgi:two-component system copper resistance phosphate regulon response regulator CusR